MTGPQAGVRSQERIVEICRDAEDSRTLRLRVLEEIRRAVGFDSYAWLLTDPETSVGSAPLADVPDLAELPALIRLKYLTTVKPLDRPRRVPGRAAAAGDRRRAVPARTGTSRSPSRRPPHPTAPPSSPGPSG